MYIAGSTTYSNYNEHILESSTNTEIIKDQKNKGWFHFSHDSLLPLIKETDELLSDYRILSIWKILLSDANIKLSVLQLAVYDAIAITKEA